MHGRLCLSCGAIEEVRAESAVWPVGQGCVVCGHQTQQRDGVAMFCPQLADTLDGFDPALFDELASIEDQHFWFVARNRLVVNTIEKFFPKAISFLEIGCGNGAVLSAVAKMRNWQHLVGSELHPKSLDIARSRLGARAEFVQMDARKIPAVGLFDLTGAFDVIEHIADDEGVLRGLRGATTAGGGTIITVPQHPWLWSGSDEIAHHERRYRRGELEEKLHRNGFEVLFSSSFTALLLPLMIASRLKDRRRDKASAMKREFNVTPTLNSIFKQITLAEVSLTSKGMRWPVGGSRLVAARAV